LRLKVVSDLQSRTEDCKVFQIPGEGQKHGRHVNWSWGWQ